jgi:hypothetical protein
MEYRTITAEDLYNALVEVCGVSEEFISGAVAVGGFTKETMHDVAYYKSGYQTVEDWVDAITDEFLEELEKED